MRRSSNWVDAAASSAVSAVLPSSSSGRSSGVSVELVQTCCRSGSPHGVRNVAASGWASTAAGSSASTPAPTPAKSNLRAMSPSLVRGNVNRPILYPAQALDSRTLPVR